MWKNVKKLEMCNSEYFLHKILLIWKNYNSIDIYFSKSKNDVLLLLEHYSAQINGKKPQPITIFTP